MPSYTKTRIQMTKPKKLLLIAGLLCLLANIPWYIVITQKMNATLVKTTATVIEVRIIVDDSASEGQVYEPIFEYKDATGHIYQQAGGETFGTDNPLHSIFIPKVGQKVTAYYDKQDFSKASFMYGIFMQTVQWVPMMLGGLLLVSCGAWVGVQTLKKRYANKKKEA
jgi:hypothetical protein